MGLAGRERDNTRRDRQRQSLRREQVDEREHAPLRQHRKGEQQKDRREQIDELRVERQIGHQAIASMRITRLTAQKLVDEHSEHGEQECRSQKLGCPEDAHLCRKRLDEREQEATDRELSDEGRSGAKDRPPIVAGSGYADGEEKRKPDARIIEELER